MTTDPLNRPSEERIPGSRPSVPEVFRKAFTGPVWDSGIAIDEFQHTVHPLCQYCNDRLTIVDTGYTCRQCRLEGRNR